MNYYGNAVKGPFAINYSLGNTAQFMAHALLEYYSVSLLKKVSARRQPYLNFLSNLTKNLATQSAHLNYAVLPLFFAIL